MKHEFINPINETFDLIERYILMEEGRVSAGSAGKKAALPKNKNKRTFAGHASRGFTTIKPEQAGWKWFRKGSPPNLPPPEDR